MAASLRKNQKGQAVFEFIIFMPLLVFLFVIIVKIGNSINLSINQQKVTRRYFYQLIKNSSKAPMMGTIQALDDGGEIQELIGMAYVGWREKESDSGTNSALAPCLSIGRLFSGATNETCEEPTEDSDVTRFIRVYTAYGICGETYTKQDGRFLPYRDSLQRNLSLLNTGASCIFR